MVVGPLNMNTTMPRTLKPTGRVPWVIIVVWLALTATPVVLAAPPAVAQPGVVAATVGGEPITAGEVAGLLQKVTHGQNINPAARSLAAAEVLAEIIDRRLVLGYARRTGSAPTAAQIETAMAELAARQAAQGRTLPEFLRAESLNAATLRQRIIWELTWKKCAAGQLSDQRLAAYFAAHHRDFDGTELSVSHILLRPEGSGPAAPGVDLTAHARAIRQEIDAGALSFAAAARKYSAGPSATAGGHLGFIPRHGVMDEAFSRAAFALEAGQMSGPVPSRFGVHLIRCDEIRPGTKQLAEVRTEVEDALSRELLRKLAESERSHTPVEFTGKCPHFKRDTRDLATP